MTEISDRYRKIAAGFTARVEGVPVDAWDNPAPCEGWVARDVVGHLVEWLPAFFVGQWDLDQPRHPSAADDPAAAWKAIDDLFQNALDDQVTAEAVRDTRMGRQRFDECFDMIGTNDVFMHTWDLSRATGQDETLDPDEVHRMFTAMEPMDQMLRDSGQYGPRVAVPDDADEQTKLIAFIGRKV